MKKIYIYISPEGESPFMDFLDALNEKQRKKLEYALKCLAMQTGKLSEPQVKHFSIERYKRLYELREKSQVLLRVVFALDTAFIFFTVVLALIGCSYFLGYKRGQEERPTGMAGVADIDSADPDRINIRNLDPAPRSAIRPAEQDWTLVLRTEPASDELPERLELELAEAAMRGRHEAGRDVPGFIFRTTGNNPLYILTVGLGRTANDADLDALFKIYNKMEGMTFSRVPRPYIGCSIAPVRELGTAVY